jgi:hypothetical protein
MILEFGREDDGMFGGLRRSLLDERSVDKLFIIERQPNGIALSTSGHVPNYDCETLSSAASLVAPIIAANATLNKYLSVDFRHVPPGYICSNIDPLFGLAELKQVSRREDIRYNHNIHCRIVTCR